LLGVAEDLQAPLVAKLKDYIDLDDLHRLNGAESFHYRQRNLPPPTNRFLSNPMECKRILGWAEQSGLWKDLALAQLTNTILPVNPNFNTAPVKVLQVIWMPTPPKDLSNCVKLYRFIMSRRSFKLPAR